MRNPLPHPFDTWARRLAAAVACAAALACGTRPGASEGGAYTLGGTVEGLAGTLILRNQNIDILPLRHNGSFIFGRPLGDGEPYRVDIEVQPSLQTCEIASPAGTAAAASVADIKIRCLPRTFRLGGVLGATAAPLLLRNNMQDTLELSAPGPFLFAQALPAGARYQVMAESQGQACTLAKESGVMAAQDNQGIQVSCRALPYPLGGTASGLPPGGQLQLLAAGQAMTLAANGSFVFPAPALFATPIAASIAQAPAGSSCQVSSPHPQVVAGDNQGLVVSCQAAARSHFLVGGSLAGARAPVTLAEAVSGAQVVAGNGAFGFSPALADGAHYQVVVAAGPAGQSCQVTGGTGILQGADVGGVAVTCVDLPYALGGTLSGLAAGKSVTLRNGGDSLVLGHNGAFTFPAPVRNAASFAVTVGAQPVGQLCEVAGGGGSISAADATGVMVACRPFLRLASGQSAGLAVGQTSLALSRRGVADARSLDRPLAVWPRPGGPVYIADAAFGRLGGFLARPAASGPAADFFLDRNYPGATDFSPLTGWQPSDVGGDAATLAMVDAHNHRVLVWRPSPSASAAPTLALGQGSLNGTVSGCGPAALNGPVGLGLGNGLVAVADADNHRVLVWRSVTATGQAADLVLGQPDLNTCSLQPLGPASLASPRGVWTDGTLLLVADAASARVLWWRDLGQAVSGSPADGVLGQGDFTTATPHPDPRRRLQAPTGVASAYGQVWVVDTSLSRVLGFHRLPPPTAGLANPAADVVLGAKGFTRLTGCNFAGPNNDDQPSDISLCGPVGVTVDGERLWVADANNHRVVAYDSL